MRSLLSMLAATAVFAAACTATEVGRSSKIIPPSADSPPPTFGSASQTSVSSIGVCVIPNDGFTLPLISPDGRWLATQVGVAPTWPTLVASKDQTAPMASSIEIWALEAKAGTRIASFGTGLVLGRSATTSGFLVEEVLDDGSRRIGLVEWPEGDRESSLLRVPSSEESESKAIEPEWVIDDGRVNAFACLSVDGQSIAWCSRDIRDTGFALAVRHASAVTVADRTAESVGDGTWKLAPGPDQSWLLPVFGEDQRRSDDLDSPLSPPTLFALLYRDGVTDLVAGDSSSAVAFEQSKSVRRLSVRMDERRSYQTLAPQGTAAAVGRGADSRLVLFDPDLRRMAIWDPRDDTFRPLAAGTFAACLAPDGSILASDRDGLVLDHAQAAPGFPPRVYPRAAVPRHVQPSQLDSRHDWVLFVPDRKSVSIVRFALLDASMARR
jgi:hypothetical protein